MSEAFKIFNDIEEQYNVPPIKTEDRWVCPVCKKEFKTETGVRKHMEKKFCFTYQTLLKDTLLEIKVYQMYKTLIAAYNENAKVSLKSFRKSKFYASVSKFVIFCQIHEVKDAIKYLEWLNWFCGWNHMNALLSNGIKESNVRNYRLYLQASEDIDSETFYDRYKTGLVTDPAFLTRSIEKSLISIRFLAKQEDFDFENIMENLPLDYQNRITEIIEHVINDQ